MNETHALLAVNGTLMRGLELEPNMLAAGATFVREEATAPCYRLWSIDDRHPAMQRLGAGASGGTSVALEIWQVPLAGLASILSNEPPGLCIGKVLLQDGAVVLGVLGEAFLCQGQREITAHGGWRACIAARDAPRKPCWWVHGDRTTIVPSKPMQGSVPPPASVCRAETGSTRFRNTRRQFL